MFDFLKNILPDKSERQICTLNKDEIAELLKTTPEALEKFEASYAKVLDSDTDDLFDHGVRAAKENQSRFVGSINDKLLNLIERIVQELINDTLRITVKNGHVTTEQVTLPIPVTPVTAEELKEIPKELRPQLTGEYYWRDINDNSSNALLWNYKRYQDATSIKDKQMYYHLFRQGLDILDLDPITYEILSQNPNSISKWLPALNDANTEKFFQIPDTTIIKVPMTLLQLSRKEYESLNPTTIRILNEYCHRIFELDDTKDYFVKTGTYSSKFYFRNAHVTAGKEVQELGEYLMFIQNQASIAAGPLSQPSIYGMSTTNEWCVRKYVQDTEHNPCIYHGMPLHTEYRAFLDFDNKRIMGVVPYWDETLMKQRFGHAEDQDSPHKKHDYIIYTMHRDTLYKRFEDNVKTVTDHLQNIVDRMQLSGQWSLDIMQNGNDFWLIDMATANTSALNTCFKNELRPVEEHWLPDLQNAR